MNQATASLAVRYAKTTLGHHEMRTRVLGLRPAARRLLVLIDGRRSAGELALLLAGHDLEPLLSELLRQGCIEPAAASAAPSIISSAAASGSDSASQLSDLPAPQLRSAEQTEMARHFMTNTVNLMFGQNMRLSLIEAIANCHSAEDLRRVYPAWHESMSANRSAVRRLPELRRKLLEVL